MSEQFAKAHVALGDETTPAKMIVTAQMPPAGPAKEPGPGAAFLDALELEYIDGHDWKITQAFDYMSDVLGRVVDIPAGFLTDFASIPRPLWNWLPPTGKYGKAAVVHDWLYRTKGQASRGQADRVLKEAMKVLGVGAFTRGVIYAGVRLGGSSSYKGGCKTDVTLDASGHPIPQ